MVLTGLLTLLVWWGATQALLWMVRAAEADELNTAALVIGGVGAVVALVSAADPTAAGALLGFGAGLALWASFEIAFLTGAVLGLRDGDGDGALPRPVAALARRLCAHPPFATRDGRPARWRQSRAFAAFCAIVWHELSLFGALLILAAALHAAPNPMALHVFALMWAMRISAKLNLFLGVRNDCAEFLPRRVRHLAAHFRTAPMNPLFPVSVLCGAFASAFLLRAALDPAAGAGAGTGAALLAVLCALGTLEHVLMMTPLSPLKLWSTQSPRVTLARQLGLANETP